MKKLFVVLLALAVIGVFVFAQDAPAAKLSVGGWGRGWFNVYQVQLKPAVSPALVATKADDPSVGAGPGWAGNGPRVSVSFDGSSENVGFDWNPGVSNSAMTAVCDQAKIWVKINPMFKVEIGHIQGDVLRGKLDDFGDILGVSGKDNIFQRFNPSNGILLDVTPIDGVYIGAALDATANLYDSTTFVASTSSFTKDVYKAIQIGAGYTIPNLGMIRAQYVGEGAGTALQLKNSFDSTDKHVYGQSGYFQAAFAYTGIAGLLIDAGVRIPSKVDVAQMLAAVGVSYTMDALSVYGRIDAKFGGNAPTTSLTAGNQLNLSVAAQAYYTVAAPLSVGVETLYTGMSAYAKADLGVDPNARTVDIYPVVKLGYSNGYLKIGFDAKVGLDSQDLTYAVPIQVEYSF
jgi:hypothetical protein